MGQSNLAYTAKITATSNQGIYNESDTINFIASTSILYKRMMPLLDEDKLPNTGILYYDRLMYGTADYDKWVKLMEKRDCQLVPEELNPGEAAFIMPNAGENRKHLMKIDPDQFRYIDLLHERWHLRQHVRLQAQGIELNPYIRDWFERGAYEYELRLANARGFSTDYVTFLNLQLQEIWFGTPSATAYNSSLVYRELLNSIWR